MTTDENKDSELILAHAWDTMLKLNFLLHVEKVVAKIDSTVDTDANNSTFGSDVTPAGFLTLIERLFVWVLDEVKHYLALSLSLSSPSLECLVVQSMLQILGEKPGIWFPNVHPNTLDKLMYANPSISLRPKMCICLVPIPRKLNNS